MHTTDVLVDDDMWYCHHNGDFSGDVTCVKDSSGQPDQVIPFTVMKALVAEWIRSEMIGALEAMSPDEILSSLNVSE